MRLCVDLHTQDGPIPNILRTHRTTYTLLGMSWGYFVVDFLICLKYHVSPLMPSYALRSACQPNHHVPP